jgi:hypothetical protein
MAKNKQYELQQLKLYEERSRSDKPKTMAKFRLFRLTAEQYMKHLLKLEQIREKYSTKEAFSKNLQSIAETIRSVPYELQKQLEDMVGKEQAALLTRYGLQSLASDEKAPEQIHDLAENIIKIIDAWIYMIVEKVEYLDDTGEFKLLSSEVSKEYDEKQQKKDADDLAKANEQLTQLKASLSQYETDINSTISSKKDRLWERALQAAQGVISKDLGTEIQKTEKHIKTLQNNSHIQLQRSKPYKIWSKIRGEIKEKALASFDKEDASLISNPQNKKNLIEGCAKYLETTFKVTKKVSLDQAAQIITKKQQEVIQKLEEQIHTSNPIVSKLDTLMEYQKAYDLRKAYSKLETYNTTLITVKDKPILMAAVVADFYNWYNEGCEPILREKLSKLLGENNKALLNAFRNKLIHSVDDTETLLKINTLHKKTLVLNSRYTPQNRMVHFIQNYFIDKILKKILGAKNYLEGNEQFNDKLKCDEISYNLEELLPESFNIGETKTGAASTSILPRYTQERRLFKSAISNSKMLFKMLKTELGSQYTKDIIKTLLGSDNLQKKLTVDILLQALGQALGNLRNYDTPRNAMTKFDKYSEESTTGLHESEVSNLAKLIISTKEYRNARAHGGLYVAEHAEDSIKNISDNYSAILSELDLLDSYVSSTVYKEVEEDQAFNNDTRSQTMRFCITLGDEAIKIMPSGIQPNTSTLQAYLINRPYAVAVSVTNITNTTCIIS